MMKNPDIQDPRKTRKQRPSVPNAQPLFSKEKKSEKCGFEEEREDAFHRDRHSDDAACPAGEFRPVRSELKTPSGCPYNAEQEVDSEDLRQKRAETSY